MAIGAASRRVAPRNARIIVVIETRRQLSALSRTAAAGSIGGRKREEGRGEDERVIALERMGIVVATMTGDDAYPLDDIGNVSPRGRSVADGREDERARRAQRGGGDRAQDELVTRGVAAISCQYDVGSNGVPSR